MTTFEIEEINIWFLFNAILALSQTIQVGFNTTLVRFISYSFSGISIEMFNEIKHSKNDDSLRKFDDKEFNTILYSLKKIYLYLALGYFFFLLILGYLFLQIPISIAENPSDMWIAWFIVLLTSTSSFTFSFYRVFLEGIQKIALVQRILGIVNLIGTIFILVVFTFFPTFLAIVVIYQSITLVSTLSIMYLAKREPLYVPKRQSNTVTTEALTHLIYANASKSTFTAVLAGIFRHISALLVTQLLTPTASAGFLLAKRFFDFIDKLMIVPFSARTPMMTSLRGKSNMQKFIPFLRNTQYLSYGIFIILYLLLILFANPLLHLIESNIYLEDTLLIVLFAFSTLLSRWAGMTLSISNQANHVVEHISAVIVITTYFLFIVLFYNILNVYTFPLAQIIATFVTAPFLAHTVYKTLHIPFFRYEKNVLFPTFLIVSSISSVYYIYASSMN